VLATGIQKAEQARKELALVLVKYGVNYPIEMPDISTKEKAQAYIGLDMEALKADKERLLETVVPKWDSLATERQGTLKKY
jgi:nitrite reductase (cytochrome c-552)